MLKIKPQHILATCPILFCSAIAITSRRAPNTFEMPSGSAQDDQRLLAYKPFVREADLIFAPSIPSADRLKALQLAKRWDIAAQAGTLRPLKRESFEDSIETGQRGRILSDEGKLVHFLVKDGDEVAQTGDVAQGTAEVLLAMRLSESLRYSDLRTVQRAAMEESPQMTLLNNWAPLMDPITKRKVTLQLQRVSKATAHLDGLVRQTHEQYYDWRARNGQPANLVDVQMDSEVNAQLKAVSCRRVLEIMPESLKDDSGLRMLMIEFKLAWRSEKKTHTSIQSLARDLSLNA